MTESETKQKLDKAIGVLESELRGLRVGRANAGMVEDVQVEVYESNMPLQQVASITIPQNNQILIQPWDADNLQAVQNAILKSDLNLNPAVEGNAIRLTLPPLTEETRKDLAKEAHKFGEEARIAIRNIREEAMNDIDKAEKDKEISEDEKFKQKEKTQELIDEYNKKIDTLVEGKENEIMEK
ncbi:MAG: ribosome recycling factor [Candidatus Spechtbacterales bacterium]|nr:ribosome recycling factor [Candidatus Spechtbacterales bacterium]